MIKLNKNINYSLENTLDILNFEIVKENKKIKILESATKKVFVSGNFNILHPGHLRLLKYAKSLGTKLIVGVFSDEIAGEGAHLVETMRLEGIKSNIWVDQAFIIQEKLEDVIRTIKPDYIVKGKEHESNYNREQLELDKYGGKIVFCSGETTFSSSYLIQQDFLSDQVSNKKIPNDYGERHNLDNECLNNYVKSFSKLKVCVIGDLIVDEYIDCEPLGMSQEDPTIVVSPVERKKFIGGAGIVAAHAASLGANTTFISVLGKDEIHKFAKNELDRFGVNSYLVIDESRPTSLKQRFRAESKTLLRVSNLHQNSINLNIQKKLLKYFKKLKSEFDLIVFSDFNYGCLPTKLVREITDIGKEEGMIMAADSQSSSQIGDITRFKNMDLITPTEKEARIGLRNNEDGLVVLAEKLRENSIAKNIFLKLGADGVLLHIRDNKNISQTDRMPALNSLPRDVAGAGDSMLISSAMAIARGSSAWEAACIGSMASSVQVGRVGNIPLKKEDLLLKMP